MINIINYYYNFFVKDIIEDGDSFYFINNGYRYSFRKFFGNINIINDIYDLNRYLNGAFGIYKIILNKDNEIITRYNDSLYILFLIGSKDNNSDLLSLSFISNMALTYVSSFKGLERNNWEVLWGNMIDYYEMQIGENEKKYPLIRESFDYFVGMAENAISYVVNTKREVNKEDSDRMVLSHNSLGYSLVDPLNIILDHRSRDVAEYIKYSFFYDKGDIFKELDLYFFYNKYSLYGIRILFARILYPSYYFKLYDDILSGKRDEKELIVIIDKIFLFQDYLYDLYLYLGKMYDIPLPEWIKKTRY